MGGKKWHGRAYSGMIALRVVWVGKKEFERWHTHAKWHGVGVLSF